MSWLVSLSRMTLGALYGTACIIISVCVLLHVPPFIHFPVDGDLGQFYLWPPTNTQVQVFVKDLMKRYACVDMKNNAISSTWQRVDLEAQR